MNQLWNTNRIARILAALILAPVLSARAAVSSAASPADTFWVTSIADSGPGTLREAITQANNNPGPDVINFDILACGATCTIAPLTPLPTLSDDGTTIDGYSQLGASPATGTTPGTIVVEIDGINLNPGNLLSSGLNILSADNLVRGLAIMRCPINGVTIGYAGATGNRIQGNHIGVTPSAGLSMGNLQDGVFIGAGAAGNTIGGKSNAERNIIAGNGWDGVGIHGAGSDSNVVAGNYIGTNGADALGNNLDGVHIYGGAQGNWVGGNEAVERNLISGNRRHGVSIVGASTDGNLVYGNEIGVANDNTAMGNEGDGVYIGSGAQSNVVGGIYPDASGNLISANLENGVQITGTNTLSNTITNNIIGTFHVDLPDLGNEHSGVLIAGGAGNTLVGGANPGEGNLISGNRLGVKIIGSETAHNTVSGNLIGVDSNGTSRLPNLHQGVWIGEGAHHNRIGGVNTTPGGECSGECNLISGNNNEGIVVEGDLTSENTISGNYIGSDRTGMISLMNLYGIIIFDGAQHTIIGGDTPGERNLISGNMFSGIILYNTATQSTVATGNYIGTDGGGTATLSNGEHGIEIVGAGQYRIGGEAFGEGNLISGNDENGIDISESSGDSGNNIISGNIIGLDASGSAALGNGLSGIHISASSYNLIGGATSAAGNTISGNGACGVILTEGSHDNELHFNRIGTSPNGTLALGNASHGVLVEDASQENIIGSAGDRGGNLISANLGDGVRITGIDTQLNQVLGNLIGSQPQTYADMGNAGNGVTIQAGASENTIAGYNWIVYNTYGVLLFEDGTDSNTVSANLIAESDFSGVYIDGGAKANTIGPENHIHSNAANGVWIVDADTFANAVTMNAIEENGGGGINLENGANHSIQAPAIDEVAVGSSLSIQISGFSCAGCIVEVFGNQVADGEGEIYLDSDIAGVDGSWSIEVGQLNYPYLTATATAIADGTSEFSAVFANPIRYLYLPLMVR